MKNLKLLFLLFPLLGLAQEQTTIKVVGRSIHYDKTPLFKGDVTLSATFSSYPENAISFEEMKLRYGKALKAYELRFDEMTEDALGYAQLRHDKEGMIYKYQTRSIKDFQGFLSTKSFGVQNLNFGYEFTIDAQEAAPLIANALAQAHQQAKLIASKMKKKLSRVMSIEDKNSIDTIIKKGMYYDHRIGEYNYDITVVFTLE